MTDHRADLINDGLLWATLYEQDGRWWSGEVVGRTEAEARDKLRPGEELDGQVLGEIPDEGMANKMIDKRDRMLSAPVCPHCGRPSQ